MLNGFILNIEASTELYVFHPEVLSNTIYSIEMYQSKHNSILLIVPINIGVGLQVSTPTESFSGPQDTDPRDKVCLLHYFINSTS